MNRGRTSWTIGILAIVFFSLIPVVWIASFSFKAAPSESFFPFSNFTLDNYKTILEDGQFTKALRNSLGIAAISTVIAVTLACMAAYAIARLDFPGKGLLLSASLAIAIFPPVSIVGPLFDLERKVGLFDTWPG